MISNTRKNKSQEYYIRKLILKEISHFWRHSIFSCIMALILQLIGLTPAIIMQQIIDKWIPNHDLNMIIFSIILFCLIPVISTVISAIYRYYLAIICRQTGSSLLIKGFNNLIYQSVSHFDKINSSEIASYCRTEAMKYVVFWLIDTPQFIASVISGIIIFLYLLKLNWITAIFLLLYIPFSFFPSNYFAKKVQSLTKHIVENNAKINQLINDSFKGIKFIKALLLEDFQIHKLKDINQDSVSIWSKVALYDTMSGIWVNNLSDSLFTGVVFGIISYLIILEKNSVGQLVIVLNYCGKILDVFKKLINTNYNFKTQLGEYDKLFEILNMPYDKPDEGEDFCFNQNITLKNIVFSYDEERSNILNDLNLTIYRGEWVGIVGSSGAGKTTVFDLLLKFYLPQSGIITIDGKNITDISIQSLRTKITKVSQDIFLFPGTIRENLLSANLQASQEEIENVIDTVCLNKFVESLPDGLDTYIGENGLLLSGGERQRLALAQGLLRKSEIILLDEVTANIDRDSECEIRRALKRIMISQKLTIISISHRIDFLQETDRIIKLQDGKAAEETTYNRLIKS